jgi:hypothetical protein
LSCKPVSSWNHPWDKPRGRLAGEARVERLRAGDGVDAARHGEAMLRMDACHVAAQTLWLRCRFTLSLRSSDRSARLRAVGHQHSSLSASATRGRLR